MSAAEEFANIATLLERLKEGGAQLAVFSAIEQALADLIEILQKPSANGMDAVMSAIAGMKIEATVNVSPTPVAVNVAAPVVNIERPDPGKMSFKLSVMSRDDMGRLKDLTLTEQ